MSELLELGSTPLTAAQKAKAYKEELAKAMENSAAEVCATFAAKVGKTDGESAIAYWEWKRSSQTAGERSS